MKTSDAYELQFFLVINIVNPLKALNILSCNFQRQIPIHDSVHTIIIK